MAKLPKTLQTIVIEKVEPELDGGRYPIKRIVGEMLTSQPIFSKKDMTASREFFVIKFMVKNNGRK